MAEKATAAAQPPLALAGRNAGREGLAATRTIGPYEGRAPPLPPRDLLGDAVDIAAAQEDVPGGNRDNLPVREA